MKMKQTLSLLLAAFMSSVATAHAAPAKERVPNPYLHKFGSDGHLRIELTDHIKHPHFWWPETLLGYQVVFDGADVSPNELTLSASDGKPMAFQLSDVRLKDGKLSSATVSFFSDLPSGGSRVFDLKKETTGDQQGDAVKVIEEGNSLVLNTGAMKVRLPRTQTIIAGTEAPGPIMAVNDGKGWVGKSKIVSPRKAVQKIDTEIVDRGPLFVRARVSYTFANDATYTATIKATLTYDFVEVLEQIEGLTKEDGASFQTSWTGLALTHRRGSEPIDRPKTLYYRGEDPYFIGPDRIENPAKEFYFRVSNAAADNTINVTAVDFTNQNNGRAIGVAVLDAGNWDDREYAVWAAHETLAVRFRYADGVLHWLWPLAGGSREMAVAAYDFRTAGKACGEAFERWQHTSSIAAVANTGVAPGKAWTGFINSRYGGMSLDVVKDWQLSYPELARQPGLETLPANKGREMQSVDGYLKAIWGDNELVKAEGNWVSPVSLRIMSAWVVPGFNKWRTQMKPEDRERVEALILFHAYSAAREEVSPMRHLLKGHPNFMADWKYPLMAGAFLFPEHPMAKEWADQFEKLLELMGVFYVRPPVKAWEAAGGRWTENIGTYNWAFIQPAIYANELGKLFDGRDRWPNPGFALHGSYLTGIVTAPVKLGIDGAPLDVKPGTPLTGENGFQRIHPPQGAHSGRRAIPAAAENFGQSLLRYQPLTGEHLLWACQRPAGTAVGVDGEELPDHKPATNHGTNPRLTSKKFTGYGIVMRAAVDTPEEIAVFLQQIDKGPNYRWGFGNEGGGGDIYYYAGGKSYSGHMMEDAGDRRVTDAEVTCNTGVYKDSTFRGIGMNDLTEPFYNLESAQFAELLPREGPDAYSWPEYKSRAVLLVGSDYIITFDAVNSMSRMSWNTVKGQDEMPTIIPIRGETAFRTTQNTTSGHLGTSESQRFEPYKGGGDRMALVTHRKDVKVLSRGKNQHEALTKVETPAGTDFIFLQRDNFTCNEDGVVFSGRAGVIRKNQSGQTELNLFHGTRIGTEKLTLLVDNPNLGISAIFTKPEEAAGTFFSRKGGNLTLTLPETPGAGTQFYVDGAAVEARQDGSNLTIQLPPGEHRWQLTAGPVEPMPPQIVRSENQSDGAVLYIGPAASAEKYRIEKSEDNGLTWNQVGETTKPEFRFTGLAPGKKVHVLAIATNQGRTSRPGRDYPIYVTAKPPEPPAGLELALDKDKVRATWGEVLGASSYILHRRKAGESNWQEVYRGTERSCENAAPGVIPAFADPGLEPAAHRFSPAPTIYEYAVSAVDGVGKGPLSLSVDTDPASWRNWNPATPLVYKRQSAYWLPPYVLPEQVPPPSYPE